MKARDERLRGRGGFTLLELLVVMVILVMLAGIVGLVVVRRVDDARVARSVADIESVSSALDQFYLHTGRYPASEEGLSALIEKPNSDDMTGWNGPYIKGKVPADPWGREYVYVSPGNYNTDSFDLSSLGRDGREGGAGPDADITNWE